MGTSVEPTLDYVVATIQNYLLTQNTKDEFAKKSFLKVYISEHLNLKIDHLTTTQRSHIYNFITKKIKHYKTYYTGTNSANENIKTYLHRKLTTEITKLTQLPLKAELNPPRTDDEDDIIILDSDDEPAMTTDNDSSSTATNNDIKSLIVTKCELQEESDKNKVQSTVSAQPLCSNNANSIQPENAQKESAASTSNIEKSLKEITFSKTNTSLRERSVSTRPDSAEKTNTIKRRRLSIPVTPIYNNISSRVASTESATKSKAPELFKATSSKTPATQVQVAKATSSTKKSNEALANDNTEGKAVNGLSKQQQSCDNMPTNRKAVVPTINIVTSTTKEASCSKTPQKEASTDPTKKVTNGASSNKLRSILLSDWSLAEDDDEPGSLVIDETINQKNIETRDSATESPAKNNQNSTQQQIPATPKQAIPSTSNGVTIKSTKRKKPGVKKRGLSNVPRTNIENFLKSRKSPQLHISGTAKQICNYYFELNPQTYELTMGLAEPYSMNTTETPDINELLYWPGVGFKLSLPEIEITRKCVANQTYELVRPDKITIFDEKIPNPKDVHHFYVNNAMKTVQPVDKNVELSLDMVQCYLELVLKCLSVTEYAKKEELEIVINTFLSDLKKLQTVFLKVSYSYFQSNYKYYRVFEQDVEMNQDHELLILRENFNPEIIFTINRCSYEERAEIIGDMLPPFIKPVLEHRNPYAIENFATMLSKGYSLFCSDCQKSETGPLKLTLINEHIGKFFLKELCCSNCTFKANIMEISKNKWMHECQSTM